MRRGSQKRPNICPRCGAEAGEPEKTWHLVSPIPDSRGRVTITIMGIYKCPSCGHRWRATISKIKAGEDVEIGGAGETREKTETESRRGQVIEIDLSDLDEV